jgi:D-glycero-D-manno-heptose 1,7-bisphosphate phosphatase
VKLDYPLDSDGVWCDVRPQAARGASALFLDRDGVVVEDAGYLQRVEDIRVIAGAAATIAAANARGLPVIVVTNQAGVGRGYYGWAEFSAVQTALHAMLAKDGARIDAVFASPHHPQGEGAWAHPDHPARKPNPGMLLRAQAALSLDLAQSWLVGDRLIDLQAAQRAGLAGALHVLTGYGETDRPSVVEFAKNAAAQFDVRTGRSIVDAAALPIMRAG